MKKFALILTIFCLLLSLVGCSGVSQEEYEAALADVANLENEVADLEDQLEDEIDAKQKEIDDLTAQVADLTSERDALSSTNDLLDSEIADLEAQIADLEAENADLRAQLSQGSNNNGGPTMRVAIGNITYEVPKNWTLDSDDDTVMLFEVPDDENPIVMVSYAGVDGMTAKEGKELLADTSEIFYAELSCEIEVSEVEDYNEFYYAVVSGQCTDGPIADVAPCLVGVTFCDDTGFYFVASFGSGDDTDSQVDYVATVLDTAVSR